MISYADFLVCGVALLLEFSRPEGADSHALAHLQFVTLGKE
jgi:hypothetical protein